MMTVLVTPETARIEVREDFSLALPKFLWRVMEARAQALHDGDLKATMTELVAEELLRWFKESIRGGVPVPGPSPN
ncbi:MAG: hypothetical protein ACOZF2_07265 [Thermodesulfobacteriota bacterium]